MRQRQVIITEHEALLLQEMKQRGIIKTGSEGIRRGIQCLAHSNGINIIDCPTGATA